MPEHDVLPPAARTNHRELTTRKTIPAVNSAHDTSTMIVSSGFRGLFFFETIIWAVLPPQGCD